MILGYCSSAVATPPLAPRGAVQPGGVGFVELREPSLPAQPRNSTIQYASLHIGHSDCTYRAHTPKSVPDSRAETAPRQGSKSER